MNWIPRQIPRTGLSCSIAFLRMMPSMTSRFGQTAWSFSSGFSWYSSGDTSWPPVKRNPSHRFTSCSSSFSSCVNGSTIGIAPAWIRPSRYPGSIQMLSFSSSHSGITPTTGFIVDRSVSIDSESFPAFPSCPYYTSRPGKFQRIIIFRCFRKILENFGGIPKDSQISFCEAGGNVV